MTKKPFKASKTKKNPAFEGVQEIGIFEVSQDFIRIGDSTTHIDSVLEFDSLKPGFWLATVMRYESGPRQGELDSLIIQQLETLDLDLDWRWIEQPIRLEQGFVTVLATDSWRPLELQFDWALFPKGLCHKTALGAGQFDVAAAHLSDRSKAQFKDPCVAIEVLLNHGAE